MVFSLDILPLKVDEDRMDSGSDSTQCTNEVPWRTQGRALTHAQLWLYTRIFLVLLISSTVLPPFPSSSCCSPSQLKLQLSYFLGSLFTNSPISGATVVLTQPVRD